MYGGQSCRTWLAVCLLSSHVHSDEYNFKKKPHESKNEITLGKQNLTIIIWELLLSLGIFGLCLLDMDTGDASFSCNGEDLPGKFQTLVK